MNIDWTVILAALIGGGLLKGIFDYFTTGRIDKTTKIQAVYEKSLDDMSDRHDKENLRNEKLIAELEAKITMRDALLEQARQTQGEMLVKMDDMQKKLNKVGDDVNQITGDFKNFPLAGESAPHGRRATDKPQGGSDS